MNSVKRRCQKMKMGIVFAGLFIWCTATADGAAHRGIVLKVVGPDGEPLARARIYQYYAMHHNQQHGEEYICDKNGRLRFDEEKVFQFEWQRKGAVLYGLYEDKLAGFENIGTNDLGKELEMKLTPACRVYGTIKSTEMNDLGLKLQWTNVYVWHNNDRPLSCSSTQGEFEFFLPDGTHKLSAYGTRLYEKQKQVVVAGQKELEVNFDLPADRLAHLIGKNAPEFRQIKGWLNSKPLSLKDLRGKVVLLDFWGTWCGPCVAEMPKLMDLHGRYHDMGLVIIGIHDDSVESVKDLENKIEELSKKRWKNKRIPFAVALDGGGDCKIEGAQQTARGVTTAAYGINSFPTMILIDKQGKLVNQYYKNRDSQMLGKLLGAEIKESPRLEPEPQFPKPQQAKPKRVLSGTITDAKTGKPVTDAVLRITGGPVGFAETDANGFYCFEGSFRDGDYRISIDSNEYVGIYNYGEMPIVNIGGDKTAVKDFKLDRGCRIKVQVVNEANQPIENAEISINRFIDEWPRNVGSDWQRRRTDKEGFYLAGGIPPDKTPYLIGATHREQRGARSANVCSIVEKQWDYAPGKLIVTLNDTNVIESGTIVLCKGVDVNGIALYKDGIPASDLTIDARPDWWKDSSCPERYSIDANGHFTMRHIVPDVYRIMANIPMGQGSSMGMTISQISLPLPNNEMLQVTIPQKSPQALVAIRGRVVIPDGNFPDYISIHAYSPSGGHHYTNISRRFGRDPCDTNFMIDRLEPGKYRLTFSSNGFEQKVLEAVNAPCEGLIIELMPAEKLNLKGTVVNSQTTEPIQRFKARARKTKILRGPSYSQPDKWIEFDDPNGKFDIETTGPGIYQIQIAADGFAWLWSEDVNTDQNVPAVIKLSAGGSIKGTVVNEANLPVNGAKVIPLSKAGGTSPHTLYRPDPFVSEDGAVKTVNGLFELKNLAPGLETIKAVHPAYAYSIVRNIEVNESRVTEGIKVVMPAGGTAEGYVYDSEAVPQANVTLYFQTEFSDDKTGRLASVTTDANGYYRVGGLPPEETLVVRRQGEWSGLGVACRTFVPSNGKTSRLDFGGRPNVKGRIIIKGVPFANRKILLSSIEWPNSNLFRCTAMTQTDGAFTFGGVPNGKWAIYYEDSEKRGEWIKIALADVTGEDTDLGLIQPALSTVRVSIDFEQGTPEWNIYQNYLQEGNKPWGRPTAKLSKQTDENEPYIAKNILPGEYSIVLMRDDFVTLRHPIRVGENDVDIFIRMPKCTSGVTGQITGMPTAQTLWRNDKSIVGYMRPDANGSYKLDSLPAGHYYVGGNMLIDSAAILEFELADGEQKKLDVNVPDTQKKRNALLQVIVLDENGIPIQGADVHLQRDANVIEPTSAAGLQVFFLAEPGTYTLQINLPGYKSISQQVLLESFDQQKIRPRPVLIRLEKQ